MLAAVLIISLDRASSASDWGMCVLWIDSPGVGHASRVVMSCSWRAARRPFLIGPGKGYYCLLGSVFDVYSYIMVAF